MKEQIITALHRILVIAKVTQTLIDELAQSCARLITGHGKMKRFYNVDVDEENEITVTSGATEGLCATILGLLEPGDEVILMAPAYDAYPPLVSLAGGHIRYIY